MKTFNTTAKTAKGNFNVIVTVNEKNELSGTIEINGKTLPVIFRSFETDRVYASKEVCEEFGVAFAPNIALKCDVSEAIKYAKYAKSDKKFYDNTIVSPAGFCMENTKANWAKVNKYGYDAIER
jgi:hypothetical protein